MPYADAIGTQQMLPTLVTVVSVFKLPRLSPALIN